MIFSKIYKLTKDKNPVITPIFQDEHKEYFVQQLSAEGVIETFERISVDENRVKSIDENLFQSKKVGESGIIAISINESDIIVIDSTQADIETSRIFSKQILENRPFLLLELAILSKNNAIISHAAKKCLNKLSGNNKDISRMWLESIDIPERIKESIIDKDKSKKVRFNFSAPKFILELLTDFSRTELRESRIRTLRFAIECILDNRIKFDEVQRYDNLFHLLEKYNSISFELYNEFSIRGNEKILSDLHPSRGNILLNQDEYTELNFKINENIDLYHFPDLWDYSNEYFRFAKQRTKSRLFIILVLMYYYMTHATFHPFLNRKIREMEQYANRFIVHTSGRR